MNPDEVAAKEFPVVMRGYAREEVQAFLVGVADELLNRDARLARLEAEIARLQQTQRSASSAVDRPALLRQLGHEAASILACADASAERIKAQAVSTTQRVRHDLQSIGGSLSDVHQLLGELVSLVHGLADGPALAPPTEVDLADVVVTTGEVRTVLGEVLGLDSPLQDEIHLPDGNEVFRTGG